MDKEESNQQALIQFYLSNQRSAQYHGERMWDTMKFFGLIVPAFTSLITFVLEYLASTREAVTLPTRWLWLLFFVPIAFTVISWLNSLREYDRFLEYALMSWRAERLLGFHEPKEKLNGKALVLDRFKEKPKGKPEFDICKPLRKWDFWTIMCLFFGASLIIQIVFLGVFATYLASL